MRMHQTQTHDAERLIRLFGKLTERIFSCKDKVKKILLTGAVAVLIIIGTNLFFWQRGTVESRNPPHQNSFLPVQTKTQQKEVVTKVDTFVQGLNVPWRSRLQHHRTEYWLQNVREI